MAAETMTIRKATPKEGPVDLTKQVEITATDKAPFHKEGQKELVSPVIAEKMKLNGWAK